MNRLEQIKNEVLQLGLRIEGEREHLRCDRYPCEACRQRYESQLEDALEAAQAENARLRELLRRWVEEDGHTDIYCWCALCEDSRSALGSSIEDPF